MSAIQLIVGLGNPGPSYSDTRHNAGAWLVEELARSHGVSLVEEKKFFGATARLNNPDVRLLIPSTFMNHSGRAVSAISNFYRIPPEAILIAHDELDLPPGQIRLKQGGGHGGHNGLRDTVSALGNNKNFSRLRIGIGDPGNAKLVSDYVLKRASGAEQQLIEHCVDDAVAVMDKIIAGDQQAAMLQLHSKK